MRNKDQAEEIITMMRRAASFKDVEESYFINSGEVTQQSSSVVIPQNSNVLG